MTESTLRLCPHLGTVEDPTVACAFPDASHRCYAQRPPAEMPIGHQASYCLGPLHTRCPVYRPVPLGGERRIDFAPGHSPEEIAAKSRRILIVSWLVVLASIAIVAAVYVRDSLAPAQTVQPPAVALVAPSPAVTPTAAPTPTAANPTPTLPEAVLRSKMEPGEGGSVVAVQPEPNNVAWWKNDEPSANHLGDSFLYAGSFDGKVFITGFLLDLSGLHRGAALRAATLSLMGLNADRVSSDGTGSWRIQLLEPPTRDWLTSAEFQDFFNVPAAFTLLPDLNGGDLAKNRFNAWNLDREVLAWLARRVAIGEPYVAVRVLGPSGGSDSLFAWDSGAGEASSGEGPRLTVSLGPLPLVSPTVARLVIVATETPTPENVMTVAVAAWTATAVSVRSGTYTPAPYDYVTPTATPANLATARAHAAILGLPAIVPSTPTPGNAATETSDAFRAIAEAFLTGTPTATPVGAVTPFYFTPVPTPANVLTTVARVLTATAAVQADGTPTPLPWNSIMVTSVPTRLPTLPVNEATIQATAAYATAEAILTALPGGGESIIFLPTPTPVEPTPSPSPTATRTPTARPVARLCPDSGAQLTAPTAGSVVRGSTPIRGTANVAGFELYQLDLAPGSNAAEGFIELARGERGVVGAGCSARCVQMCCPRGRTRCGSQYPGLTARRCRRAGSRSGLPANCGVVASPARRCYTVIIMIARTGLQTRRRDVNRWSH